MSQQLDLNYFARIRILTEKKVITDPITEQNIAKQKDGIILNLIFFLNLITSNILH